MGKQEKLKEFLRTARKYLAKPRDINLICDMPTEEKRRIYGEPTKSKRELQERAVYCKGRAKAMISSKNRPKLKRWVKELDCVVSQIDILSGPVNLPVHTEERPKKCSRTAYAVKQRLKALDRSGHECEGCGCKEYLEVHHIVYRSKGGTDELSNLKVLCDVCHMRKHEGEPVHNLMMKRYMDRVKSQKLD